MKRLAINGQNGREASAELYTSPFLRQKRYISNALDYLEGRSTAFHIVLNCALVLLLGAINYSAVNDISAGIFYLIPVSLVAWFLSSSARIAISFLTATVWLTVDVYSGQSSSHLGAQYLNAIVGFSFLIFFGMMLGSLRRAYNHQKGLARTDYLTQLANARAFYESTELEIIRSRRYEHPFTLAYLDMDDFKAVNDTHGHSEGDRLLKTFGVTAEQNLRETDLVARLGGDEFAILLPETDGGEAQIAIENLREILAKEMRKNGWVVTFSIGVVTCLIPPESVSEALKKVDNLAYEAKNCGKNAVKYDVIA